MHTNIAGNFFYTALFTFCDLVTQFCYFIFLQCFLSSLFVATFKVTNKYEAIVQLYAVVVGQV